jgi:predicted Zn-dependent peptidase
VDRPDSVQSAIRLGTTGIARRNADHIPLMTLNTLFGGYFNSRINHNLREQHGYTYGARSVVEAPIRPGAISVAVAVRADVTDAAVGEIFNELEKITSEPVTAEELEMVKNYLIGSQALQIETPGQVASFVRTIALYDLPVDYYQTMPAVVRALTREEMLALAQRRLCPETMIIVVVGDASAIREKLERFGPVSVVDVRGNKQG